MIEDMDVNAGKVITDNKSIEDVGQEIFDLIVNIALQPTSSINKEGRTIDKEGKNTKIQVTGRHDPCVGIRATPIAESMIALVLMDHYLRNRAQNADVDTKPLLED